MSVACLTGGEPLPATVIVDARQAIGSNDRFWASAVFHPTEYLDSEWGREHLALPCNALSLIELERRP